MCKRPGCRRPTEVGGFCPADYRSALRRSHRGGTLRLRPTQSDWGLASDGIVDDVAVSVAAKGERLVRLTPTERLAAARQIVHAGGGVRELRARLGINHDTALTLRRACKASGLGISALSKGCGG